MTRYYKTSYGYKSSDGSMGGVLAAILLVALAVWFFSAIFIPMVIILGLYLVYWFCSDPAQRSGVTLAVLSVITVISGVCYFAVRSNQAAEDVVPKISLSLEMPFLATDEVEPMLGEEIKQGDDGNYYVILTDHCTNYEHSCKNAPDIRVEVKADGDAEKIKAELSVTQIGMEKTDDMPFWMQNDTEYFKDKVLYSGDHSSYVIDGDDFRMNESGYAAKQPTKLTIEAKNKGGSDRITLIVTKLPVYLACSRYNEQNPGKSAVNDVGLCRERQAYVDKEAAEKAEKEKAEEQKSQSSSGVSGGSSGASASGACLHYEAGRCWDDLELEAYDQGRYDKIYGSYGQGYYESGDCDSVCQSILEEAYDEGYYDGW